MPIQHDTPNRIFGMRDSLSINEEHIGFLSDLLHDPNEKRSFSEPKKTRNIFRRHTIDEGRCLNNLPVHDVPDGSSDKRSVALIGCVHPAQESRLEVRLVDALNSFRQVSL